MEGSIIEKIYDMIKRDILGVSLSKRDGDMKFNIYFRYDEASDIVSYVIVRTNGDVKSENKGIVTNEEELFNLFRTYELQEAVTKAVNLRIEKEAKYQTLRDQMMERIGSMNLSDRPRVAMTNIINKTTQLSEYVGNQNRVTINKTDDVVDQLRVTDETNVGISGENLHLQLVQTVEDSSGDKFRNYPKMSFEELVAYILSSEYVLPNRKLPRRRGR